MQGLTRLTASVTLAAIVAVAALSGTVTASGTSDAQLVETRVAAMKENGKVLKGAKELTGAAAVDAATTILRNFSSFPSLFRKGSITPDSRATAGIWENWADFSARMSAEKANASAMLAAAKAGDRNAYVAAIEALKKPCSSCHLTYARVF